MSFILFVDQRCVRDRFLATWSFLLLGHFCFGTTVITGAAPNPTPAQYLKFALTREGNPVRGRELFISEERLVCTRCHTVDGTAGKAGPDLFAVGEKYGRRELIESVLTPSAAIAVGYNTTTVLTKSDDEYSGIIKQASPIEIGLMGADAQLVRIPVADIAERHTSEVSLMPEGLQESLSLEEFNDLIEYLVTLKQPAHSEVNHHGMPEIIETLAHPVQLLRLHGPEIKFEHPVCFEPVPGLPSTFLIAEHDSGKIWRFTVGKESSKALFLNTGAHDPGARGLIGVAFHPRFTENHRYYIVKQVSHNGPFASVITELEASEDFTSDSGKPGKIILSVDGPTNVNHAGSLLFGSDGYLYIAMGDSGPPEDPQGHGQDTGTLLGKILRVDIDHPTSAMPYSIPSDNPFVGRSGFRPEIWAYGLREPWRCSFDPITGEIWVGDVGQDRYEEIDLIRPGENLGWNVVEGFESFSNRFRRNEENYVRPIFGYRRKFGPCVTGGFVYHPNHDSSFNGVYIFGDYESRRIFGLTHQDRVLKEIRQIGVSPERIASFGQDRAGELYIVGYEGTMFKMDFNVSEFR